MKHILSSDITSTSRQPYTKVTHEYYNAMINEAVEALGRAVVQNNSSFTVLYGCVNSAAPNANISAGAIFYNGEIYLCDAFVDGTISNAIVGTITTIYDAADPVLFSDGTSHNVHQIKKIVWSDAVSGTGSVDFANLVAISISSPYVNITSGLTFKYVDNGGTLRTIVASPTLTIFKYRLIGKTCHLQINITNIDTSTSNSGTGFSSIQILGMPSVLKSKTDSAFNLFAVKYSPSGVANEALVGQILNGTADLILNTLGNGNTSASASNTRLYGEITYEII